MDQSFRKTRNKGNSLVCFPDSYCIIDIETTGLSPEYDSIIEISAIKYENGINVNRYSSLVRPDQYYSDGNYIDEFIQELTGITNEMLSSSPDTKTVLMEFKAFIGNEILIGHNVNFDINFLYDNFEKYFSEPLSNNYIDTMRISRMLHPAEPHHRLCDLTKRYNIDHSTAHRALYDCLATQECYIHLKSDILNAYGDFDTFINTQRRQLKASDIISDKEEFDISHPLYKKNCVFTGTLEKMSRKEAMQIVADFGGINNSSITSKTNYLILGNNDYCPLIKDGKSNKQKKAEKLKLEGHDIEIIPENVFYDMI